MQNHDEIQGNIKSIEEASSISQLLTPFGLINENNFIAGNIVSTKRGEFFGKKDILNNITTLTKENGFAVLVGGHRTGRSSLINASAHELVLNNTADADVLLDFVLHLKKSPDEILSYVENLIETERVGGHKKTQPEIFKAVIKVDHFNYFPEKVQLELLKHFRTLISKGHFIIMPVDCDLNTDITGEITKPVKDSILEMTQGTFVINKLMSDQEIKHVINRNRKPYFTKVMLDFLIRESGGNPYLANSIALRSLQLLKKNNYDASDFKDDVYSILKSDHFLRFKPNLELIKRAGFDPITWDWHGSGEKPDVDVYRNMIPDQSATLFRRWLSEYLNTQKME